MSEDNRDTRAEAPASDYPPARRKAEESNHPPESGESWVMPILGMIGLAMVSLGFFSFLLG